MDAMKSLLLDPTCHDEALVAPGKKLLDSLGTLLSNAAVGQLREVATPQRLKMAGDHPHEVNTETLFQYTYEQFQQKGLLQRLEEERRAQHINDQDWENRVVVQDRNGDSVETRHTIPQQKFPVTVLLKVMQVDSGRNEPQGASNQSQTQARSNQRRTGRPGVDGLPSELTRCTEAVNNLASFKCTDPSKKGDLAEKNRFLFELSERRLPPGSTEEEGLFQHLLHDDAHDNCPRIVEYAKSREWYEIVQKAIVLAPEDKLKCIAQKFNGKLRSVGGDAYGSLVLQQLLLVAVCQAQAGARGVGARTIFSIFKSHFVDEECILLGWTKTDKKVAESANFVAQMYVRLQALLPEEVDAFTKLAVLLSDHAGSGPWGLGQGIALSKYGCRLYKPLLEIPADRFPPHIMLEFVRKLLVFPTFSELVTNQYGNFVIGNILKERFRPFHEKFQILENLATDICYYALDRSARHVVQLCFEDEHSDMPSVLHYLEGRQQVAWWRAGPPWTCMSQKFILSQVFKGNGKLKPEYEVIKTAASVNPNTGKQEITAANVEREMRKAFHVVKHMAYQHW